MSPIVDLLKNIGFVSFLVVLGGRAPGGIWEGFGRDLGSAGAEAQPAGGVDRIGSEIGAGTGPGSGFVEKTFVL